MSLQHTRLVEVQEARISWLEAEVQRQGNIITDQADRLADGFLLRRILRCQIEGLEYRLARVAPDGGILVRPQWLSDLLPPIA